MEKTIKAQCKGRLTYLGRYVFSPFLRNDGSLYQPDVVDRTLILIQLEELNMVFDLV